jgi:hypothetical protein
MKKKTSGITAAVLLGTVLLLGVGYAAQQAADEMTMNSNVYGEHKKPLVTFTHTKHSVDYKIACADCHHVFKDGKNVWKEGDEVEKCEACHSEAKAPAGKDAPTLSKQQKIEKYHYSAIHENCVGCHKAEKKEGKAAPTTCKDCHSKE